MTDRFSELLAELGKILGLQLIEDKYQACSIQIPPLTIQLQLDPTQENLILFSKVIDLPPGKFRENVLGEALKANALPDPRIAIFSYIAKTNHLAIFQTYPISVLSGEKLSGIFGAFFELGESWHSSIQGGRIPSTTSLPSTPFGIRP